MKKIVRLGTRILISNLKTLKEPYKITFSITDKCNSKCKTCGIWKKKSSKELTIDEISKIFENIDPSWVNVTGGEPFLRDDIYEIAKIIKKKDVYLFNLTTNGILEEKIFNDVKKILKLNFPKFITVVSLDGPKKIHDKIRGVNGNWHNAVSLFKKLREMEIQNKNFKTYFGYTISKYNINLIFKTIEEVKKEIKVSMNDFHFNIYHTSKNYFDESDGGKINGLTKEINKQITSILKEKNRYDPISLLEKKYLKLIEKYFEAGKSPKRCKALISSCYIASNGDVFPCTIFNKKLGNLRDFNYNLKSVWNSRKSDEVRKMIKQNECSGCWTPCEAYQSILGNLV